MKKLLICGIFLCSAILAAAGTKTDDSLLFKVTFDGYSTDADFAEGQKTAINGDKFELNLRMFQGVNGQGNALAMDKSEELQWHARKNFDPRQGTVSLWLSPVNWQVAAKSEHRFLQIYINDFHLQLRRDKNSDERIVLYLHSPKINATRKACYATARIDPASWSKNSWHKIDITWDAKAMKLYVDGVLQQARRNMITGVDAATRVGPVYPVTSFPPGTQFPDEVKFGIIRLGAKLKVNPEERTAYDVLEIRNRVLGASEIMQEYRKVIPEPKKSDAVQSLSVPALAGGTAANAAAVVPILNPAGDSQSMRNVNVAGNAFAAIWHDNSNLYVKFSSPEPALRRRHTVKDSNVWEDDSFELHLKNPAGNTVYQFIVNANGAVRDSRNSRKDWNSRVSAAIRKFPETGLWEAVLTVPMSDLDMCAGENWHGNFGMTLHRNQTGFFAWSGKVFQPHGKFFIAPAPAAVQINKLGALAAGELDFRISGNTPVKAAITGTNGVNDSFAEFCTAGKLQQKLATGNYTLKVVSQDGKFAYEHDFFVSNPFEVTLQCLYPRRTLNAVIDLTNSGKRHNSGTVKFLSPAGKVIAEKQFRSSEPVVTAALPLDPALKPGKYLVQVSVDGIPLTGRKDFTVPDMTALKSTAGLEKFVPKPWTPVQISGKTVTVWNRKFVFDQAPFPVQIYGGGRAVFQSAPQLLLNGEAVKWSDFRITGHDAESVRFCGSGTAGNARFNWQGEVAFDGLLKIDFTLEPAAKELKIASFTMRSVITPEFARHVRAYNYTNGIYDWQNDQVTLKFSDQDCPFVWLLGNPDGIYFGFNALANWVNNSDDPHLRLLRRADGVELNADVITKPAVLKGQAAYCWTFMPTPVRPMPANRRTLNWGSWRMPPGINLRGIGGTTIHNYLHWQDLTSLSSFIPRDKAAMKANLAADKSGVNKTLYGMPVHISSNDPEYDYLAAVTAQLPSTSSHKWTKANQVITNMPSCGHTDAGNMMAHRTEQLFKDLPMLYGLYFDIANAKTCRNTLHGHGGVDAFGQNFHTSTELPLRKFFLRVWKLAEKYDKQILLHVSAGKFTPVTHSYQHGFAPGEELYGPFAANPDYFYCEIPENRWQTLYNPEVYATELFFLFQQRRSALGHPHLRHRQQAFLNDPEWTYRGLTPVLLHDANIWNDWVNDNTVAKWWKIRKDIGLTHAKFTGYWNNCPFKSVSPDVKVSSYSWSEAMPYKTLLVIGNCGRKPQAAGLELPAGDYTDLWNDRKISAAELKILSIPGNHFLLIGIK